MGTELKAVSAREMRRAVSRRTVVRVLAGLGVATPGLLRGDPAAGKKRFAVKKDIVICYQNQTLRVATKAFLKGRYPGALTGACPA